MPLFKNASLQRKLLDSWCLTTHLPEIKALFVNFDDRSTPDRYFLGTWNHFWIMRSLFYNKKTWNDGGFFYRVLLPACGRTIARARAIVQSWFRKSSFRKEYESILADWSVFLLHRTDISYTVHLLLSEETKGLPEGVVHAVRSLAQPIYIHFVPSQYNYLNLFRAGFLHDLLRPKDKSEYFCTPEEVAEYFPSDDTQPESVGHFLAETDAGVVIYAAEGRGFREQVDLIVNGVAMGKKPVLYLSGASRRAAMIVSESSPILPFFHVLPYKVHFSLITKNTAETYNHLDEEEKEFLATAWFRALGSEIHGAGTYNKGVLCRSNLDREQAIAVFEQLGRTDFFFHYDPTTLWKTMHYTKEYLESPSGVQYLATCKHNTFYCGNATDRLDVFSAIPLEDFLRLGKLPEYRSCKASLKPVADFDRVLFISHPWEARHHPDPRGIVYEEASKAIGEYMKDWDAGILIVSQQRVLQATGDFIARYNTHTAFQALTYDHFFNGGLQDIEVGVWIDWSCLPQYPRSSNEEALFRTSLASLNTLISNRRTHVVVVPGEAKWDYFGRAWCKFEWLASRRYGDVRCGQKDFGELLLRDLSSIDNEEEEIEECRKLLGPQYAQLPKHWVRHIAEDLANTKVTNGKDRAIVYRLLAEHYIRCRKWVQTEIDETAEFTQAVVRTSLDEEY